MKRACVRWLSWWRFSLNVYNGTLWLWKEECRRERSLFVASYLIALWVRSTGSHEVQLFFLCVCVCVCALRALHISGKWEVTCLLKHQTSKPFSHTHIHNSNWHIVVFFSCPRTPWKCVYTGTHTHAFRQGVFCLGLQLCVCWKCSKQTLFIPIWSAHHKLWLRMTPS